jgi:anti-sigma regulatory factor (Ser/Thr protein kinase)
MMVRLIGDVHAPGAARTFVRNRLPSLVGPAQQSLGEDLALIVSELVTNSVRAHARVIELELCIDQREVEVRVTDDAAGWPTARTAADDSLDGRGLDIVDQLADSWRTVRRRTGKTVIARRQISDWTPARS